MFAISETIIRRFNCEEQVTINILNKNWIIKNDVLLKQIGIQPSVFPPKNSTTIRDVEITYVKKNIKHGNSGID